MMGTSQKTVIQIKGSDAYREAVETLVAKVNRSDIRTVNDVGRLALTQLAKRYGIILPPPGRPPGRPRNVAG